MKLMFITNEVPVASILEDVGVDRVFVDLERIGKQARQGGMDTVQSHHTVEDVKRLRAVVRRSELLVRTNPVHPDTEREIEAVIGAGADLLMLPYFQTVEEVQTFLRCVRGRARTMLLFETPAAAENAEAILELDGIDECYIGLNDLHLGYGKKFLFELLADGTVDALCGLFRKKQKPFGFGGIARLGTGMLSAEHILKEHVRLGSSCVILSRSFCNPERMDGTNAVRRLFETEIPKLRAAEQSYRALEETELWENHAAVGRIVASIAEGIG